MFDRFFFITHVSTTEDLPHPHPLFDCLICLTEPVWQAIPSHAHTLRFLFDLLQDVAEDTRYRTRDPSEKASAFIHAFDGELTKAWQHEKDMRLSRTTHSPMPWSARSRWEGIPPPPASFEGVFHTLLLAPASSSNNISTRSGSDRCLPHSQSRGPRSKSVPQITRRSHIFSRHDLARRPSRRVPSI